MLNQLGRSTGQRLLRVLPAPAPSWQKVPGPELPAAMVPMAQGGHGGESRGDSHFLPSLRGRFWTPRGKSKRRLCVTHTRDPCRSLLGPYAQGRISKTLEKPRMEDRMPA